MTEMLSELADSALLAPAALLLGVYLCALRQWRIALAFAGSLALVLGVTLLAKLAFRACGHAITDLDIVSPSGHASFASAFYGMLAAMLAAGRPRAAQAAIWLFVVLLVLAVGASRVRLGVHSVEEVAIGWAIGAAGLWAFLRLHRAAGSPRLPTIPLAAGFAVALLMVGGRGFTPERYIAAAARRANAMMDICTEPARRSAEIRLPVR